MNTIKQHTYLFLLALASLSSLSGCSADDLPGSSPEGNNSASASSFQIHVTDGGYASADAKPGTRAEENGYKTVFTEDDRIGVFAVKGDQIVNEVNNLCLTAANDNGRIVWKDSNNNPLAHVLGDDVVYYAYYPYREPLTGDLASDATDAAGFFTNVITNWSIATDQGTYTKYTAQDLMIAKGTVSGKELSFSMQHQMALVVIDLPRTEYKLTSDLNYTWLTDAPDLHFTDFSPCRMSDGTYRYLVRPSASSSLSGSYTNTISKTWQFNPSVSASKYKIYKVDRGSDTKIEENYTLQVGDFYMKDGSLVSKDVSLSNEQKAACLGIVMKVGKENNGDWIDDCLYNLKNSTTQMTTIHGYVLALYNANGGSTCQWSPNDTQVNTDTEQSIGFYGYKNTQTIINYDNLNNPNLQNNFPATYYATEDYENKHSAPNNSSGWFLPSAGQCLYWFQNKDAISTSMTKAGGNGWSMTYWSSSECSYYPTGSAWYMPFYSNYVGDIVKYSSNSVRSCLAF